MVSLRYNLCLGICLLVAPAFGQTPATTLKRANLSPEEVVVEGDAGFKEIELFTEVLETIRQNYVDADKVSYEQLINSALEGMLSHLDPHSQFLQPKVFEQLQRSTDSTYEGIGVTISTKNDALVIVTAREDGPAARAGLLPGDQILKINDQLTEDVGMTNAVEMLRGKPGESLRLTIRRPATQQLHEFELKREVIRQSTVKDARLLNPELTGPDRIGYVRILQFSEPTASELADALDLLEKDGLEGLVLDMRNNPGGLLNSAIDVCGEFVKAGTVVLTTEGRQGTGEIKKFQTTAAAKRRDRDYPLAILVNHSSASGSEVVAGALQDLKRCIVVGETTFGKGSVQAVMPIGEGKAIRLTTAKYYTPSHRTIHENGVVPNIIATLTPEEERRLLHWFNRENLAPEERKKAEDFSDPQLIRAVDAMKGALVYSRIKRPATAATPAPAPKNQPTTQPSAEGVAPANDAQPAPDATPMEPPAKEEPPSQSAPDSENKPAKAEDKPANSDASPATPAPSESPAPSDAPAKAAPEDNEAAPEAGEASAPTDTNE